LSQGQRFPLRPQPLPEESLSSWIDCLAAAMGVRGEDILVAGLDMPPLTAVQLDYHPPLALIRRLAERTHVATEVIRAMTVQSYVPLLLDRLDTPHGLLQTYAGQHWFFVAPESRAQQQGHALIPWQESPQRGLRTCPLCLRHDPRPYRRLYWRLSWMSRCPDHGVLLEESPGSLGGREGEEAPTSVRAPPDLLFLDHLTLQAITRGAVVLPNGHRLHGGSWLRMVRALIDELCLTMQEAQQASTTLRIFWARHDLAYREGVRRLIPFEMRPPDRQCRLLTVAGTAIRMLCDGQVVSRSPWARLFAPSLPEGKRVSRPPKDGGGSVSTRDPSAPSTLGEVFQQWIDLCRTDPESAAHMRHWLLAGYRSHPDPATSVDHLLTELGIPIVPIVTYV
jgi:TniQ protein